MPTTRVLDEEGHPLVGDLLRQIRDVEQQRDRFRFVSAMKQLGIFLGYEIARQLPCSEIEVSTSLGSRKEPVLRSQPVLATVLRAGLPCLQGFQEVFPYADTLFIGAMRKSAGRSNPGALDMEIDFNYAAISALEGKTLIYVDAMIATGSTLRTVHPAVCEKGGSPSKVIVSGTIAFRGAIAKIQEEMGADVVVASRDDQLNEQGYIVPGLGDAGDLAFGPKL